MEQLVNERQIVEHKLVFGLKSARWQAILQWLTYIFYGICFGMIPALFKLSNLPSAKPDMIEIMGAINLVLITSFSIAIISWSFASDLKQNHPHYYYLMHLLNGILMIVPTIMVSALPITTQGQTSSLDLATNIFWRQSLALIGLAIHSVLMIGFNCFLWIRFKRTYALTQARLQLANPLWILLLAAPLTTFMGAKFNLDNLPEATWYLIVLASPGMWLITTIISATIILWIRRNRHVLLGDLTNERLVIINDWDYLKNGALFSAMIGSATFLIAFNWNNINTMTGFLAVEISINIVLIAIMATIGIIRQLIDFKSKTWLKIQTWCKKQDMLLIFELLFVVLILKALVLQIVGLISLNWQSDANLSPLAFQLAIISTISAIVYLSFKPFLIQNISIRNNWSLIAMIVAALMMFVFITVFASLFGIDDQFPPFLPALMLALALIALTISIVSQIISFTKAWTKAALQLIANDADLTASDQQTILTDRDQSRYEQGQAPLTTNDYIDQAYVDQVHQREHQILN